MNQHSVTQLRLPGFNALETVFESNNSTIFRGERLRDNLPVLIKVLKSRRPTPRDLARLRREFEIAHPLQGSGIVRYYSVEPYENGVALIMEDFRARSLADLLRLEPLRLERFLELARQCAEGLTQIHAQQVIHKDIKPHNIVVGTVADQPAAPATTTGAIAQAGAGEALKYIDFGISSKISRETAGAANPGKLEGTLAYMSPEQTGRMNRAVDYRSDFYSLGVTLFEMLFGRVPFPGEDAMELVHSHIARDVQFPDTSAAGEEPPATIIAILAKLLAKTAEDRYESAYGLRADFERCLRELREDGKVSDFPIGEHDFSDVFQIPQKLYGREKEIAQLLEYFQTIEGGDSALMLVAGKSGVGKSALLGEIHKPIARAGGHYIAGKFDQYKRNIPFSALIQAFQELIHQLLGESDQVLADWKDRIVAAFGPNGQVIIDVIPEVELITGEQMPLPDLPPTESRNRFNLVFQNFIRAFATADAPLAIFLDDLQWADSATLALIKVLLTDPDAGHLLIVGAYRDNEVHDAHPLILALEEIRLSGARISDLNLQPLSLENVTQLTADALHVPGDQAQPLAELVFKKTDGNPFYINELLRELHSQGFIAFDRQASAWTWDLPAIQSHGLSEDVLAFMATRLRKLDRLTLNLMRIASALGSRFDLRMLSLACGTNPFDTAAHLERALQEGLILPRDESYKYITQHTDSQGAAAIQYAFVHDRVQQAAYDLLDSEERATLHRALGRLHLEHLTFDEREERLLGIVNHLNIGRELLSDEEEKLELARLNLAAGRKAKSSTAYEGAVLMFHIALEQLPDRAAEALNRYYQLYIDLNMELGETYYMMNDLANAEKFFEVILARAKTGVEKLRVYEIKIGISTGQSQPELAVQLGVEALDMLGIRLSTNPTETMARSELSKVVTRLKRMSAQDFLGAKTMQDPVHLATMQILMQLGMPAYILSSNLFPILIARMMSLSLKHGNCPATAFACAAYGSLLAGLLDQTEEGYRYGTIAIDLTEKLGARDVRGRVYYLFASTLHHWKHHVNQRDDYLLEAYRSCLETGDLPYVALCVQGINSAPLWTGTRRLSSVERSLERYDHALFRTGQKNTIHTVGVAWQYIRNMQGAARNRARLSSDKFQEDEIIPAWESSGNANGLFFVYWNKAALSTLFGNYEQAVNFAEQAWTYVNAAVGTLAIPILVFYHTIARIGLADRTKSATRRRELTRQIAEARQKLQQYAGQNPRNFTHMLELVDAELARQDRDHGKAMDLYDQAIQTAGANGFILHEGLANELSGHYYSAQKKRRFAAIYFKEARQAYNNCRALAKASDLDLHLQELMRHASEAERNAGADPNSAMLQTAVHGETVGDSESMADSTTTFSDSGGGSLDMSTVIKASQAIAGEIQLADLLQKMIRIVMENAGAQRAVLLLEQDGRLRIEADGQLNDAVVQVLQSVPLEDSDELPRSVINTVERTGEALVVYDARDDSSYSKDPYVTANQPRSVLAKPVILQGKLIGILYLENNGAPGAFTEQRVRVLNILSSQIGTSIDNARLYSNLEAALEQERLAKQAQIELNKASSLFVPTEFLCLLDQDSIVGVNLGENIQKEMTVLFSDIRSFTSISEKLSPEQTFQFINGYLAHVGPCVRQHNGFIDKYIGDAVMALFPTAADGVAAAIAMHLAMVEFNRERAHAGRSPVGMGVGINTGQLMLGTIGEANRMEGTVISDAVNLASRIESLTKMYGASLIVSGQTFGQLADPAAYAHRLLDRVRVKGKQEPVEIIEILDAENPEQRKFKLDHKERFEQATAAYRAKNFARAANEFKTITDENPTDLAAKLYRARCIRNHREGVPDDWNGVEALGKK
ncbi:MAG: AAA family ATPase [bacterium]|nr:AAA family ATPase [bacterium]